MSEPRSPDPDQPRGRQTLAAVVIVAVLALAGWWLLSVLQQHREAEDCLASGRRNCVPLDQGK